MTDFTFDPEALAQQSVEGEMSTSMVPCPEGEYDAIVDSYKMKTVNTKSGERVVCDVFYQVLDADAIKETDRDPLKVRGALWLDLLEDGSGLDLGSGKNIGLGLLREALGQNGAGPWQFDDLVGQQLKILVNHRIDGDNIYDEVKKTYAA